MRGCRGLLVLVVLAGAVLPASAGWIFNRKTAKPDPVARVPELLQTLKADGDESKRAAAAEELRQYDPIAFPGIIPALAEALMQDAKSSVRAEAAQSLGKLRPVNSQAGKALEQALANDSSMRVRLQARSSLLLYHMAGYSSKDEGLPVQTKEPPLAEPPSTPGVSTMGRPPPAAPSSPGPRLAPVPRTAEPPLAPPERAPVPKSIEPQPLPKGSPAPAEQGPDLGSPR